MKTASIRVPDDVWDDVRAKAQAERMSANAVVVKALQMYLRARPPKADKERIDRLSALVGVVRGGGRNLADDHDGILQEPR